MTDGTPSESRNPDPCEFSPWEKRFLASLKERKSVTHACLAATISRNHAYRRKKEHPAFSDAWDEIIESTRDDLEASAMARAIAGVEEPLFYSGKRVMEMGPDGTKRPVSIRRFSDALTIFMLKAHRARYRFGLDSVGPDSPQEFAAAIRNTLRSMRGSVAGPPPTPPEKSSSAK